MQRSRYLLLIITAAYVLYPRNVLLAQKTRIYTYQDVDMKTGLDLFEKEKFGAAQYYFTNTIHKISDPNSLVRIDAEYYAALCAVELFNKDAEEMLVNFIYQHPESPKVKTAYFHLGKYKYRKKQYDEAINWFEKVDVNDLDKEELQEYYFKRGYSYFDQGNFEEASKDLFEIRDIDNKYAAPATFYYSHIAYKNKNYETAYKGFQKLVTDENFGGIVPYYIAQIMFLQGKYDEVISYAPPLLNDSNNVKHSPEIAKIVGESFYRNGKYAEAATYFEKYKSYVSVLSPSDWYELGYSYYKSGQPDKALEAFKNTTRLYDGSSKGNSSNDSLMQSAFYHMGDCYLKKGDKQLALNSFYNAYGINADKTVREDALFSYAKLSYELSFNPFSEAIKAFELYLKEYPNTPRNDEAYGFLVDVYLTTKNYEAALHSIENIKALTPNLKAAYQKIAYYRAVQLFNDNELAEAITHFDKSLQYPIDKNFNALAKYWKGEAYYKRGEKSHNTMDLEASIKNYKDFLFEPGAIDQPVYNTVNYSIGYAYFKERKYPDANTWFRKFTSSKTKEAPDKLNDAYLRIADGFFVQKDYDNASDYYDKVLEIKANDVDYALFQKAMVQGLLGKHEAKSKTLIQLLSDFSGKTEYEAAAEYELARSYEMLGANDKAFQYYSKVVTEHPGSSFVGNSMLQLGNLQNKKGEYDAALNTLNDVLNKYPYTDIALEAVNIIREVCKKKGDTDCLDKLKNLNGYGITVAKLDSDNYEIAKNYYFDEKFDDAYKAFSKYQQKFPDGAYITDVYFYKGEIDYKNSNLTAAVGEYNYVNDKPRSKYSEIALAKSAWINYKLSNYSQALIQYSKLETIAEFPADFLDARVGQMRCNFALTKFDDAIAVANKIITLPKLSNELLVEAHITIARSAVQKVDYETATKEFQLVLGLTQNEKAAEAKYSIAEIQYLKGQFKESQKTIFEVINQKPSYGFWVGKSFLLLSDVYIALGDRYNAKYTLKTYIDKSTNAELVAEAKLKLSNILEVEHSEDENTQKKKAEQYDIQFKPGNGESDELFNETGGDN